MSSIDLRDKMSPIRNQGKLHSSAACAVVNGVMEYLFNNYPVENVPSIPLSAMDAYYLARCNAGTINEDSGTDVYSVVVVAVNMGIAAEIERPYNESTFTQPSSEIANIHRVMWRFYDYFHVDNIDYLKRTLNALLPVAADLNIYGSSLFSEEVYKELSS
jgi:hypothetical protein